MPAKIVLLARNLYEDFIDKKSIAVARMPALESPGVVASNYDTPQSDRLVADCDTTLGRLIFNISTADSTGRCNTQSLTTERRMLKNETAAKSVRSSDDSEWLLLTSGGRTSSRLLWV